jgi:hypothetical protein
MNAKGGLVESDREALETDAEANYLIGCQQVPVDSLM